MHRTLLGLWAPCVLAVSSFPASAEDLPDLSHWKVVLSFRPAKETQNKVKDRGTDWAVHRIEDAVGDVNVDVYSVHVSKLPSKNGVELKPHEVLNHVRKNLNEFVDQDVAKFKPYDDQEKARWNSDDYTGAILLIDMRVFGIGSPDSGCVVATKRTKNEWIFSTIRAGGPTEVFGDPAAAHPVSGNRAFGVYKAPSGKYVFYNVAADRPTRNLDEFAHLVGILPAAQQQLWKTFQDKLVNFVNDNDGTATLGRAEAKSYNWTKVKESEYYDVSDQPDWE